MSYSFNYGATGPTLGPNNLGYIYNGAVNANVIPNGGGTLLNCLTISETGIYIINLYGLIWSNQVAVPNDSFWWVLSIAGNPGTILYQNRYYGYPMSVDAGTTLGVSVSRSLSISINAGTVVTVLIQPFLSNTVGPYPDATTQVQFGCSAIRIA